VSTNHAWWNGSDCESHDWNHVGDDLVCDRCKAVQPKCDPLVAGVAFAAALAMLVGVVVAAIAWASAWVPGGAP